MLIIELKPANAAKYYESFLRTIASLRPITMPLETFRQVLNRRQFVRTMLAVDSNDEVVGTLSYFIETKFIHNGGKVCHVEDVAVREDLQRRGIGRELMGAVEDIAQLTGCYKIILDCGDHNLGFYEKCGYSKHESMMRKNVLP